MKALEEGVPTVEVWLAKHLHEAKVRAGKWKGKREGDYDLRIQQTLFLVTRASQHHSHVYEPLHALPAYLPLPSRAAAW